ncbi:hypothetical protein EL17_11240 [Anditalea andensis]|uniref:Glycosyltransferase 2-like domain-containing protein n=2 Tax=Anditalea andensis TaxID=1048983 RepID=A0A074L0U1_9BACT|nr:hypothetical protein EL17_11240 [Anditalea andensis]
MRETKPGSYAARNKGVKHAKGRILAFTDSDCIPDVHWLAKALDQMNSLNHDRITGPVKLYFESLKPSLYDQYELIFGFDQIENVKNGSSVTANLIVRKDLFDQVGLFNENLKSGGDHEWNLRATKMGFNIGYYPDLVVRHPTRSNYSALRKKAKRIAGGKYAQIKKDKKAIVKMILRDIIPSIHNWNYLQKKDPSTTFALKSRIFFLKYILSIERAMEVILLLLGKQDSRQ